MHISGMDSAYSQNRALEETSWLYTLDLPTENGISRHFKFLKLLSRTQMSLAESNNLQQQSYAMVGQEPAVPGLVYLRYSLLTLLLGCFPPVHLKRIFLQVRVKFVFGKHS